MGMKANLLIGDIDLLPRWNPTFDGIGCCPDISKRETNGLSLFDHLYPGTTYLN
jgi:hypothetical protein